MSDGALGWFDDRETAKDWPPSRVYAMGFMAGEGQRVWFSGPHAEKRERWVRDARQAWITEVKLRATPNQTPLGAEARLETIVHVARGNKTARSNANGTLAERFVDAFGSEAATLGEQAACLAAGIDGTRMGDVLTWNQWASIGSKAAAQATTKEAWCQIERAKAEAAPRVAPADGWSTSSAAPLDWLDVDAKAHALMDAHGLGMVSVPGSWSLEKAGSHLADAAGALSLIARETGLGPGSAGLGGWGLTMGLPLGGSEGRCFGGQRTIALGASGGEGALAHEWLHALDFELSGLESGKRDELLSERAKGDKSPLGALLDELVEKLCAPGLGRFEPATDLKLDAAEFAKQVLLTSGIRNAIVDDAERAAYDGRWTEKANKMFQAVDEPSEHAAFDELKAVYRSRKPGMQDGDFDGLWGQFAAAKRPDPEWEKKLEAAKPTSSDFLLRAMSIDLRENKSYAADRCEMLARAFESAVALDAARKELGSGGGVRMVSNFADDSPWAPQGAERGRAREAFIEFFDKLRPALAARHDCPQWAKSSPVPILDLGERFSYKLALRRQGNSQPSAPRSRSPA